MFAGKPIIGILGGIGSGKSYIARIFGELGCLVINSDEQVALAYGRPEIKDTLRQWWGAAVFKPDGSINRAAVAAIVFNDPAQRKRLEGLIYPVIGRMRDEVMAAAAGDPAVRAYVWDAPLLVEAGLAPHCDVLVFVEADQQERQRRVRETRGWTASEWAQREKLQLPLDKKRQMAKYMVRNTAGAGDVRSQVREVLSRILAGNPDGEGPDRANQSASIPRN